MKLSQTSNSEKYFETRTNEACHKSPARCIYFLKIFPVQIFQTVCKPIKGCIEYPNNILKSTTWESNFSASYVSDENLCYFFRDIQEQNCWTLDNAFVFYELSGIYFYIVCNRFKKKTTYYNYTKTALLLGTIHLRRPQFGGRSGLGQISLK